MTTTPLDPIWILKKKAVLVSIPDSRISCHIRLSVAHDKTANEGLISLRFTAQLANLGGGSQVLMFNIPPKIVRGCELFATSNDDLCPSHLLSRLPAPETDVSEVSTLSLKLGTTGIVLSPAGMESLSPANPTDQDFAAFANLCQSTSLLLHISKRQFAKKELGQLETFSGAVRRGGLQEKNVKTKRDGMIQGMVQKDWRIFSRPDPPPPYPYYDKFKFKQKVDPPRYEPKQVIGKRGRDRWSHDDESPKILLLTSPPPDSPTEVSTEANTPETLSRSPSPSSIRQTFFAHALPPSRTEPVKITCLEQKLRDISDKQIRELLIRTGHQHLLAGSKDIDSDLPSESKNARVPDVEISDHLKQYVKKGIDRRLRLHVSKINKIFDSAVSDFGHYGAELDEQVEAGNFEIRRTASECMEEMDQQAQQHVNDIKELAEQHLLDMKEKAGQHLHDTEERVEQRLRDIEKQAEQRLRDMEKQAEQRLRDIERRGTELENDPAKLKRWINVSAQSSFDSKSSPHQPGTKARCSSI